MTQENRCSHYDTCVGSKPFFVGFSNPNFHYTRNGYLPSQCGDCPGFETNPIQNTVKKETVYIENLTDGQFLRLQALVANLRTTLQTHITNQYTNKKSSSEVYIYTSLGKEGLNDNLNQ